MNYAMVENGIVTNVIWLYSINAADFPSAVPCRDIPAAIGDTVSAYGEKPEAAIPILIMEVG